jgi:hypothetical protein
MTTLAELRALKRELLLLQAQEERFYVLRMADDPALRLLEADIERLEETVLTAVVLLDLTREEYSALQP